MISLTSPIIFAIVFGGVIVGRAQEARKSIFLDTTSLPIAELSIKNTARYSSTVLANPSSSFIHDGNMVKGIQDHDDVYDKKFLVTEVMMVSSNSIASIMMEHSENSSSDSALIHSDSTFQMTAAGLPSPSASWDTSLMPSFTTIASHSLTKLIYSTVHNDAVVSQLEISQSSTIPMPDLNFQQTGTSTYDQITPYTKESIPNLSSHMTVEKSSSDIQLNGESNDSEISRKISASENAAVIMPNTEFATPSRWYVFETESMNYGLDMLQGNHTDETTVTSAFSNATTNQTDDRFKNQVVPSEKSKEDQSHHDAFVFAKRLGFVLKNHCSDDQMLLETFQRLNGQLVRVLLNSTVLLNENESVFVCERVFHLTVFIKNLTDDVIKKTVKNVTENFTFGDGFWMEEIYLYKNGHAKITLFPADAQEQIVNNSNEHTLSERELIAYVVAGISLATLLFILLTCCCVRFLCKKQATSLDLCDIPHLNLKLEDYKLTPIPRPTISFSEYGRELFNPSYNEHTPKLEDTILNQHFAAESASPGARESMSFPREMRTFGGKKSCTRVQSLDARPSMRSGNGYIHNSREKLSADFERRNSGFDNVAFRKWF